MPQNIFEQLNAARSEVARLEQAIRSELAQLPQQFGFGSTEDFVAAVKLATAGAKPRKQRRAGRPAKTPAHKKKNRRRAVITDEVRAIALKLAKADKTDGAIAGTLGISKQSVFNIRKAAGLVKAR